MSYRPTVVARGEPIRLTDINGASGVRSEAAWWWEAGPVSSCCCCFPLRVGVGILAMLDFLALGYWEQIFLLRSGLPPTEEAEEALNRISYHLNCEGETPVLDPHECGLMADQQTNVERMWDSEADVRAIFQTPLLFLYVEAAVAMICGAIGLWGVFASSARAAKWYLWTWLPRLLFGLLFGLAVTAKWPVAHTFLYPLGLLMFAARLFWLLYYVKMVWSYQEVLKRRIYRAPPSGSGSARNVGGDVELNASRRGDDPGFSAHLV